MKNTHSKDESFIRLLFMVLFAIVLNISISIVMLIGFVQWLIRIIRDDEIVRLKEFSSSLNEFNYQTGQFLTLNSEQKPFPFSDWPTAESEEDETEEPLKQENDDSKATSNEQKEETTEKSHLKKQQENDLSHDSSIIDQDLTDDEQLDSMKESDS